MKILVTGGAGFIGTNFIYYQLEKHPEDQIICIDKLTYAGNLINLDNAMNSDQFDFIEGDIADVEKVDEVFAHYHPDIVVNFAAESHVDRSILDPGLFIRTNVIGTQVLMDACRKYGITRYHQISTDEVYGDLPLDKPELLFTEDNSIHTSTPYAASKAAADLLVMSYYKTYNLPVSISRSSNNFGPYQHPEKLIPKMISRAKAGEVLPVHGTGSHVRDWIYVQDHCSAIDVIIRKGLSGKIYNVGANNEKNTLEVVKTILNHLNQTEDLITFVEDRPGNDLRYGIDSSKLKTELSWQAETNFNDGIGKTIDWYINNFEWLKKIVEKDEKSNN